MNDNKSQHPESSDKARDQERIRREIAEYEALLENELKPIPVTLGKEEEKKEEATGEEKEEEKKTSAQEETEPVTPHGEEHKEEEEKEEAPPEQEEKEEVVSTETAQEHKPDREPGTKSAPPETVSEHAEDIEPPERKDAAQKMSANKIDILEKLAEQYGQALPEEIKSLEKSIDDVEKTFQEMVEDYIPTTQSVIVGEMLDVPVVVVHPEYVLVDLGGKSEAVVDIEELTDESGDVNVHIGDRIKVVVTGYDEESGQILVSHTAAARQEALESLVTACEEGTPVSGKVVDVVKSGVLVDVNSIKCFMPASQIDIGRVDDLSSVLGKVLSALVIEADPSGKRLILSRRQLLESEIEKKREELFTSLEVADTVTGTVKAVMDFGVFIDLGGVDGFVPREEVSREKNVHPSEYFKEGKQAKVKVIALHSDSGKITLSRKHLKPDPWETVDTEFPEGKIVRGEVVNIVEYGAFVRLTEGLTGLVHISDISWTEHVTKVENYVQEGQRVRCSVLEVDKERQRIALGLKQLSPDPWEDAKTNYPKGVKVTGKVRSVSQKGIVVDVEEDLQGFIPPEEISWEKRSHDPRKVVKRGDEVEAITMGHDENRRRLTLSLRRTEEHPFDRYVDAHPEGSTVQGKVKNLTSFGAFVELEEGVEGLLHISQVDVKRVHDIKDVLSVGQPETVKIVNVDKEGKKIGLSRREHLLEQEKREVKKYLKTSKSGGMKLGELLKDIDIEPSDSD